MASEDLYDELQVGGVQDDLYEDLTVPANGHPPQVFRQNLPPQLPPARADPRAKTLPNKSAGLPPSIPTRAPTTSLTGGTIRTMPPQQAKSPKKKDKKTESPPKKNPKSPPPTGGIDMNEILKRRQKMNSRALEDLDKSRQQQQQEADSEDKHAAPWLNQLKKTNRTPVDNNDEPKEEEIPEFIRKRRSMSVMSEEDENVPKVDRPTPKPRSVTSISSESDKPPPAPKPKPAAKPPKPAVAEKPNKPPPISPKPSSEGSPKTIPKPKARTSVNSEPPSYPAPSIPPRAVPMPMEDEPSYTQPTITSKMKLPPPVPDEVAPPPPPKTLPPPSVPPSQRSVPSSDSEEERPPTPPRTCPPPSLSSQPKPKVPPPVPNTKAPFSPPKMRPPLPGPPSPPRTKAPPPLPNQEVAKSEESQPIPCPPRSVPPIPGELTLPQSQPPPIIPPLSSLPKPPAPLPPTLSPATHGEPTPTTTVLRYRRLPLPPVDINNPPPLPSRNTKLPLPSSIPSHVSPPLIPTESMVEEEDDIYDDTAAISSPPNEGEDQELYDDITGISVTSLPPLSTLPSIPPHSPHGQNAPPPKLPDLPPPLSTLPPIPPPLQRVTPPTFAVPPPPVPELEENEEYDEPPQDLPKSPGHDSMEKELDNDQLYDDCALNNQLPQESPSSSLPRSPVSRSSLALPPPPDTEVSPRTSPTLGHKKGLTKEEKRLIKEEEKKQKEQKKLELQREKERKKKEEIRIKNRQKTIKQFKEFKLPDNFLPLYAVEITEDRKGSKDHMAVSIGEKLSVILIRHDKLHESKFLVEKEDGTLGLVDKAITSRTVYESTQQTDFQSPNPEDFGYGYEDLYEAVDIEAAGPPPALPGHPPPSRHLSPPIPTEDDEEPQDVYEYLPEADD